MLCKIWCSVKCKHSQNKFVVFSKYLKNIKFSLKIKETRSHISQVILNIYFPQLPMTKKETQDLNLSLSCVWMDFFLGFLGY